MSRSRGGIDVDSLRDRSARTPRSARDVADKKLRAELRAAGDAGASKKGGAEREEDLAEFYKQRNREKLEAAKAAKQKLLLENPTQSLIDCACGGAARMDDLQFLVSKGVDLDDQYEGRTALAAAAQYGSQVGVEALVRAGADVDLPNDLGTTALMVAVSQGHLGIVTFLLDYSGANPALVDKAGHSALQCAFERGHTAIASKIVKALAAPPQKITAIAKEKIIDQQKKAEAARKQEMADKKALLAKTIQEVKDAENQ